MLKIFDDVLTTSYSNAIEYEVLFNLNYHYTPSTSYRGSSYSGPIYSDQNTFDCGQLECNLLHPVAQPTPHAFFDQIKPLVFTAQDLLTDIEFSHVERCKVNMLWQKEAFPENHYNIPHQDSNENHISMVYYINDSDGDTYLFNEIYDGQSPDSVSIQHRITPKKNRLIVFDSKRYHASSNPRNTNHRFVINFVIATKNN